MRFLLRAALLMVLNTLLSGFVRCGNIRYFVTEICGQEIGPDFGTYLEFDKDGIIATDEKFAPTSHID